ncbi:hypothetical protein [Acetobacter pasteurianus]|uniref:Uncharacterized protein n=1 Tax=Acetobacter pasteurianus NBRC 3188 TaxID=1226663 RepID=A0A401WRV2_ACEPA|nr:hypothetical protein [Acetobacter pasteurianus]GCD52017.1 hypothetical protein NBRC3188_0714 [Acetobacter pasteurianus NBRC 3188]
MRHVKPALTGGFFCVFLSAHAMPNTNQHPALTFVMSEHQFVSIVRRYLPSQQTINRAEGLASIGFEAAEMAGATSLLAAPEPLLSKLGGIALAAHGVDMMAAGQRAWNTATPPQTRTERAVRAAALKAHAPPAVANLAGAAADALIPGGLLCSRVFRSHSGHSRGFSGRKPTNLPACRYRPGALPPAFAVSSTAKTTHQPEPSLTPSTEAAQSQPP